MHISYEWNILSLILLINRLIWFCFLLHSVFIDGGSGDVFILLICQVQNPHNIKYNGTVQGLKYIWRTEGFRGLFKGNGTNCARIVPNSAVKFFSYEQASKYAPAISLTVHKMISYLLLIVYP